MILLCCITFDMRICCHGHFSSNAGFMQVDVLLIAVQHTAQIWSLSPSDLCCIQKQSMLITLWAAAGLMWLLRFQSSCSSLWGVNPPALSPPLAPPTPLPWSPEYRPVPSSLSPTPSPNHTDAEKVTYASLGHLLVKCCLMCEALFFSCLCFCRTFLWWLWTETSNLIFIFQKGNIILVQSLLYECNTNINCSI